MYSPQKILLCVDWFVKRPRLEFSKTDLDTEVSFNILLFIDVAF